MKKPTGKFKGVNIKVLTEADLLRVMPPEQFIPTIPAPPLNTSEGNLPTIPVPSMEPVFDPVPTIDTELTEVQESSLKLPESLKPIQAEPLKVQAPTESIVRSPQASEPKADAPQPTQSAPNVSKKHRAKRKS